MAYWRLTCVNCKKKLIQFMIEDVLENFYLPPKPEFPKGGKRFDCPSCGHNALYQRTDLIYAASDVDSILDL
jgi:hypothetical protein